MKGQEFAELLEKVGCRIDAESGEYVWVTNPKTGRSYKICTEAVADAPAEQLKAVLRGDREPQELRTWSRIVGYFSYTDNWNKSKLGELEGRRKGNYDMSKT